MRALRKAGPVLAAAALGTPLAALAAACNPVTPYAAIVDGNVISPAAVQDEMQGIDVNPTYRQTVDSQVTISGVAPGTYSSQFAADVLTLQIRFAIVAEDVARRHLSVTPADMSEAAVDLASSGQYPGGEFDQFPKAYQQVLIRRQADLTLLAADLGHVDISPSAVSAYAASHAAQLQIVCVSRILTASPADAAAVEADLAAGASFAAEAQAKSTDTSTNGAGGALGCHPGPDYSQLGPAVEQAVETLPVGQASPPVDASEGTDVLEVTSRSPLPPNDVAAYVRSQLTQQGQATLGPLVEQQVAGADVVIDGRYGRWDRSGPNGAAVAPPAVPQPRSDART